MNAYINELLSEAGYYLPGYQRGFVTGIIVVLVVLLILRLLILFFNPRRRRCQGVDTKEENGVVFISAAAISDLINALECEFDGIKFSKTLLYKRKTKYCIKLYANLETKEVNFPDLVSTIRNNIFNSLSRNLGIDCIDKIDIFLRKIHSNY